MTALHTAALIEPFSGPGHVVGHLLMRGHTLKEAKAALIKDLKQQADACTKPGGEAEAEALERCRIKYGLTKGQFADVLGMAAANYGAVSFGKRRLPSASIGRAVAIGVPLKPLLAGRKIKDARP